MNRTPPLDVRRILRQEVGYGCPFSGCRSPYLTWHHFDPPWKRRQHHEPSGMLALCAEHHKFADGGLYSDGQLRLLKTSNPSPDDVKIRLPWAKKSFLVRVGGEYRANTASIILIDDKPLIELRRGEGGFLSLSFTLESEDARQIIALEENDIVLGEDAMFDLEIAESATKVMVWHKKRSIGLELTFRRISPQDLDTIVGKDEQRAFEHMRKAGIPVGPVGVPMSIIQNAPWRDRLLAEMPTHLIELAQAADRGEATIRRLIGKVAIEECSEDDGLVPFLDFRIMVTYRNGKRIDVRNGIEFEEGGWHFYNFGKDNVIVNAKLP